MYSEEISGVNYHVVPDTTKYTMRRPWYRDFWMKVAPELPDRSWKFVGKHLFSSQTREKVAMVLYSETGKLIGTVAKTGGYVYSEDVPCVCDEIAKGLACVTIVVARLTGVYGISFQECVGQERSLPIGPVNHSRDHK